MQIIEEFFLKFKKSNFKKFRKEISKAFQNWANVAPLKFMHVCQECESDFDIKFVYGEHGDFEPFVNNCIFFLIFVSYSFLK